MATDPASFITALAGAAGIVGGFFISRRGQADTHRQQVAADSMGRDRIRLEETQQAVDALKAVVESVRSLNQQLLAENTRVSARADRLELALDKDREERRADRERWAGIEGRCLVHTTSLIEGIKILKATVMSEIAMAAADKVLLRVGEHPHEHLQEGPTGGTDDH